MTNHIFDFIGGDSGQWQVTKMSVAIGEPIEVVSYLKIVPSSLTTQNNGIWTLKGLKSNIRYAEKEEKKNS